MNNAAKSHGAIVLMGVSGCGKSTVGRLLAADLNCAFIEGDDYHDASCIAKMRAGIPLTDEDRWPWFDRIGNAMRLAIAEGGTAVVSCSALKRSYRERLTRAVTASVSFVLLEVDRAALLARLNNRTGHFMPATLLDSQLAALEPPTLAERALILAASSPPPELCASIRDSLGK